jgi:predicted PurR-regulated permease PerM
VMLSASLVEGVQGVSQGLKDGSLKIPPPPDSVADWPLIGEPTHKFWQLASTNLEAAATQLAPQLKSIGSWLLSAAAGAGAGVLQFVIAIIIAGAFMANADGAVVSLKSFAVRLVGERGEELANLSGKTVRSVAQGVLGVAVIQALLAGTGLLAMDVPGAGFWALLVLLLAIVQLPPILVLGPIIVYVFSVADTVPAVLFLVWSLLVSMSDGLLKPFLLGRGLDIPMLVILIGAIGGMISSGIIGLFIGSVILAVGYKLFMAWLEEGSGRATDAGAASAAERA